MKVNHRIKTFIIRITGRQAVQRGNVSFSQHTTMEPNVLILFEEQ